MIKNLMDRLLTIALSVAITLVVIGAMGAFNPAPVPPMPAPMVLDSNTLIVVHTQLADGTEVAPAVTIPLWQYVWEADQENAARLSAFEGAFEGDLHNGDQTFHLTHELIDGKKW